MSHFPPGYRWHGLTRFDDDRRLNFTRIESEPDVHFAHKQGFVAKTSATDPERLKELLALAEEVGGCPESC